MRMRNIEAQGPFFTAFYELTWPMNWEQCVTFGNVLIHHAFWTAKEEGGRPIKVEVGAEAGDAPEDVTHQVEEAHWNLERASFAKEEHGFLVITGFAASYGVDMRITVWNQTNQCLLQLRGDRNIESSGDQNYYDRFADAMEIWTHVETVKKALQSPGSGT